MARMDYFGLPKDVERCEHLLHSVQGRDRLAVVAELAWYLRQRDAPRARALIEEARRLLTNTGELDANERACLEGRLLAVTAVDQWLSAQLDQARTTIALARGCFESAADPVGIGDSLFIEAYMVSHAEGSGTAEPFFASAARAYASSGDTVRMRVCDAMAANQRIFDAQGGEGNHASSGVIDDHPGVEAEVEKTRVMACAFAGDVAGAIVHAQRAFEKCSEVGDINAAIVSATNVGWGYNTLNDHARACEWVERALALARSMQWPRPLASALQGMGSMLHLLHRNDAARDVLLEGLKVLEPFEGTPLRLTTSLEYGHVLFDLGEYEQAQQVLAHCVEESKRLGLFEFESSAFCLQARTLGHLGELSQAIASANEALELARRAKPLEPKINALRAFAEISRIGRLLPPAGSAAASAPIHYLEQAVRTCSQIEGYLVPDDLLNELSRDYEAAGDLAQALANARRAAAARERTRSKEADNLTTAMQVRHETERARAEANHHKMLAQAEAAANLANAALLAKLRSVLAAAPVGIAFTRDQRFELVSLALCLQFGREEQDLLGRSMRVVFGSDTDYEAFVAAVEVSLQADEPYTGEYRMMRADGTLFWAELRGQRHDPEDPDAGTIWTFTNVDRRIAERTELEWSATHDPLTGLANRKAFELQGKRVVEALPRSLPAALVMIDLDRFKPINDTEGHAAGDAMLKAVANAITSQVRAGDLVVRQGGDEFALLLTRCPPEAALRVAENVRAAVAAIALPWQGKELRVGASLGVASLSEHTQDFDAWTAQADAACYKAKADGRNAVRAA